MTTMMVMVIVMTAHIRPRPPARGMAEDGEVEREVEEDTKQLQRQSSKDESGQPLAPQPG